MSIQTPLARVRHLGSAKEGADHWWWQRLTAILLVPLSLWFVASICWLIIGNISTSTCSIYSSTFFGAGITIVHDFIPSGEQTCFMDNHSSTYFLDLIFRIRKTTIMIAIFYNVCSFTASHSNILNCGCHS